MGLYFWDFVFPGSVFEHGPVICCCHMLNAHPCRWVLLRLQVAGLFGYRVSLLWACVIAFTIICLLLATLSVVPQSVYVFVGCQCCARASDCVSCDFFCG